MGSGFYDGSGSDVPPGVWALAGVSQTEEENELQHSSMPDTIGIDTAFLQTGSLHGAFVTQNLSPWPTERANTHYSGESSSVVYPPYGTGFAGGMTL